MVAGKFVVSRKKRPAKTGCLEYTHYSPKGQTWLLGAALWRGARSQLQPCSSTQAVPAVSVTADLLKMKR
jgi:hypothetical protein